jgi:hypothetical protein
LTKNEPVVITKTANGFLVESELKPNHAIFKGGFMVFETVGALTIFIEDHFKAPEHKA